MLKNNFQFQLLSEKNDDWSGRYTIKRDTMAMCLKTKEKN